MKKTTLNSILMGIIVVLCISICFLIFCIAKRPRYIEATQSETAVIAEIPESPVSSIAKEGNAIELPDAGASTTEAAPLADTMRGKTSTRVNIRDRASEDAKVLDTVEEGTTFEIVEVLDNGWTHILYEDTDAYISSAYVIITSD